ncbi:peptidyl-prolyl cis-trans isomerase, partial [bacterium]|nr:peptidyl-prolyl cis-trans isomerase [bacterium]
NDVGLTDLPEVAAKLDEARRMILASAYEQFYLLPNTSVDSSEVWAYYQEHSEEFVRSNDEVLLDHIMFSDTAFKDSVVMLLDSLGFEELAERFGLGQEGYSIGSTEYLSKKQIHASIARKAFALAEGEMAGPIKTEFGYHFIRLVDFAPKGSLREFSEVSLSIRDFISEQKFQELYSSVLDSLRSVKAVTIDTNAVKEALAKHEK